MTGHDSISYPSHYVEGRSIEPIEVIEDWGLGFHLGNALKYIARSGRKNDGVEDLQKAVWYLERRIDLLEESGHEEAQSGRHDSSGILPCNSCNGSGSQQVSEALADGAAVVNVTFDSDSIDGEAVAEAIRETLTRHDLTRREARTLGGSYL
ncbi:hypothetical protein GCM10009700_35090 [Brevibacterium sanguinis]|uniref:DUF3310 domain-containing protein n=1 Tax=Brevibacterium sanguinis TaxID=232444 RepID=UPI0031D4E9D2